MMGCLHWRIGWVVSYPEGDDCSVGATMPARRTRPILLPLLGLLLAGCGVAEYEARMKEAQQRIKQYDEESKLLTTPVALPTAKNESGQLVPVATFHLRLPQTVSTQPSP